MYADLRAVVLMAQMLSAHLWSTASANLDLRERGDSSERHSYLSQDNAVLTKQCLPMLGKTQGDLSAKAQAKSVL